jgi:uncharacterized protein YndB with AHSA1/START domain
MRLLKRIAIAVLLLIAVVCGIAAFKPDSFRVQRETDIKAPPEKVFALLNDFRQWGAWSPWDKLDPAMKRTYSGPASGQGARYAWVGNGQAGEGEMAITSSLPPSRVAIDLSFVKPMETRNQVEFTLERRGDAVHVTWAMQGPMPFVSKVLSVFVSMDKMVGGDFEQGLANLKAVAEKP